MPGSLRLGFCQRHPGGDLDCQRGSNQQWNVNADGTITNALNNLCLDANGRGTANGTQLILWSCSGQSNQQWRS
ncbi:ricin-type beta-trefoil lectin domain protein [Lentzea indica]|uniref:ricin-type beta-trefoil lectin domain protein n=1 Tax=Lentzea indica TaxID=2604800 RepID=UPI0035E4649F